MQNHQQAHIEEEIEDSLQDRGWLKGEVVLPTSSC